MTPAIISVGGAIIATLIVLIRLIRQDVRDRRHEMGTLRQEIGSLRQEVRLEIRDMCREMREMENRLNAHIDALLGRPVSAV